MNLFSQVQSQKQGLRINPQQIQFLNFLYFNRQELEENIKNEILENPFLQETSPNPNETNSVNISENAEDCDTANSMRLDDVYNSSDLDSFSVGNSGLNPDLEEWKERKNSNRSGEESFQDDLFKQFTYQCNTPDCLSIGEFIIYNTDNRGFLNCDLDSLVDDLSFSKGKMYQPTEVLKVKEQINALEPYGFAAFDLQDYLKIKMYEGHLGAKIIREKALVVLEERFDLLISHDYATLTDLYDFSKEEIFEIVKLIQSIPLYSLNSGLPAINANQTIVPDYRILEVDGKLFGNVIGRGKYSLDLNNDYIAAIEQSKEKEAKKYAQNKIKSALWFIDAIRQREETMTSVIKTITMLQADYLKSGEAKDLKPMILKDVANLIDMTISTVSRVTSNKYAETPIGIINLKDLFSEKIVLESGREVSNLEVQNKVKELISKEDKSAPLSDFAIQKLLKREGINLERRTITKYRLSENIPSSIQRKQIVL